MELLDVAHAVVMHMFGPMKPYSPAIMPLAIGLKEPAHAPAHPSQQSIGAALREAFVQLDQVQAKVKHVILLTDGKASYDGIRQLVDQMTERRITIFACVPQFFYLIHQKVTAEVAKSGWLKRRLFRGLIGLNLAGLFEFGSVLPSSLASLQARHPVARLGPKVNSRK